MTARAASGSVSRRALKARPNRGLKKDVKKLLQTAQAQGCSVKMGGKHWKVRCPRGTVTVSGSPSSRSALAAIRRDLRKAGVAMNPGDCCPGRGYSPMRGTYELVVINPGPPGRAEALEAQRKNDAALAQEFSENQPDGRPGGRKTKESTVAKAKKKKAKKKTAKRKPAKKRGKKKAAKRKPAKRKAAKKKTKKKAAKRKPAKKRGKKKAPTASWFAGPRGTPTAKGHVPTGFFRAKSAIFWEKEMAKEMDFAKKALKTEQRRSMLASKTVASLEAAIRKDKRALTELRRKLRAAEKDGMPAATKKAVKAAFKRVGKDLDALARLITGERAVRRKKKVRKVPPRARQLEFKAMFPKTTARSGAGCSLAMVKWGLDPKMCSPKAYGASEAGRRMANQRHHGVAFNPDDYFQMGVEEGKRRAGKKNTPAKKKAAKRKPAKRASSATRNPGTSTSSASAARKSVMGQIARL